MKIEELAEYLCVKPTYLKSHWAEIVRSNAKVNIELCKRGRGAAAQYGIKGWGMDEVVWDSSKLNK